MEGKHIKRVINIGAKAAQLGTAFLTRPEAGTYKIHKHYLLIEKNYNHKSVFRHNG